MPPVIYYVRHGLTDWNVQKRLQGRHDIPLNIEGCMQAARCGEILRDILLRSGRRAADLDYVSSPLIRARRTMELMRETLGLDPSAYAVDPRLAELAFGEWEGLTYCDVIARDGDMIARRKSDKWGFRPPLGESYAELAVRIGAWWRALDRDVIVAAHGGTARALIASLAIASPQDAAHVSIDHGVVYMFVDRQVIRYG